MSILNIMFVLCAFAGTSLLNAVQINTPVVKAPALDAQHIVFHNILQSIVKTNGVDYASLKNKQLDQLQMYQKQLALAKVPEQAADKMAFYINVYNALTLALVIHTLPVDQSTWARWSVRKVDGFWKTYQFEVAGTWMTLDHIEHKVLRPMGDPHIHFAVNCASQSCPSLRKQAYQGKLLETQLSEQEQAFLSSTTHIRMDRRRLFINPILHWFSKDFEQHGGVRNYLLKHTPQQSVKSYLKDKGQIKYFSYDWSLNIVPNK